MSLLMLLALLAASWDGAPLETVETRTIRESIPLAGVRRLAIDNLYGAIAATGDGGSDIRMVISERIEAADRAQLERARREVSLDISRDGDRILVCVDGPFREPEDCTELMRNIRSDRGYRVVYEFELRVPRSLDLSVRTIEGDLVVSDVRGRLEVGGVNGTVEITGAAGPVRAGTVNGPVRVRFAENPGDDSTFSTVNGEIDVTFQPDMAADLSFDTMNGEVMTDFEHRILPPVARRTESHNEGTTWRLEIDSAIRIGRGGPRHRFTNINGDITIHRN